jgi:hypothetical protein
VRIAVERRMESFRKESMQIVRTHWGILQVNRSSGGGQWKFPLENERFDREVRINGKTEGGCDGFGQRDLELDGGFWIATVVGAKIERIRL